MTRLLLDTHIALNWATNAKPLSRDQARAVDGAESRGELLGISAITLLEIVLLVEIGKLRKHLPLSDLLALLNIAPFALLPITPDIACEVSALPTLKDPFDRTIAATARVHGLRLVTSDQRIIDSNLVSTIE